MRFFPNSSGPTGAGARWLVSAFLGLSVASVAGTATAQPRPKPGLRTPGKPTTAPGTAPAPGAGAPTTPAPGAGNPTGGPGTGAPSTGGPGTGAPGSGAPGTGAPGSGAPGTGPNGKQQPASDPNDPLSKVGQGAKEIDFKPKAGGFLVSFNLDDAELPDLVKAISNVTGKRFIYGQKLKSIKATVYSPEKVTAAEAYNAFLSILAANGLTVIPHGQFLEIVESQGASTLNTPIYGQANPVPPEDRYLTRLYRLTNVGTAEVKGVLDKFKSKDGDIVAYEPGNLLIITETGENIRRMLRIIEEVDVGAVGDQIWVQPVLNGSATEMAAKLNEILGLKKAGTTGAAGGSGASANIYPDERTGSLIITSTRGDYERLLELLKRIDVPLAGEGQLHVLPLQHAQCSELSQTLNGILGKGGSTGARPGTTGTSGFGTTGGAGGFGGGIGGAGGFGGAGGTNRPGMTGGSSTSGTSGSGSIAGTDDIFEGLVKVTCDDATNSLITTSSQHDYAQLREVIDKLDQARRQVFIEAVIMDLNVTRSTDWGIGYHGGAPIDFSGNQGFFYGGENPGQSISGLPANLEALALGVRGPDLAGSENILGTGVSIPALGVVLHAVATDGDANILATPHILATDNMPAQITIGQEIPTQTNLGGLSSLASSAGASGAALGGLSSLLGGSLNPQSNRTKVGTTLLVKPHVNDSNEIRMDIQETISDLGSRDGALGAATINDRSAQTTLTVRDQQTVVIGGLMRESDIVSETKIPILGDIPILGFLFKQHTTQKQRSNLLLILTPYVVRNQDDLRAIFERKMEERQDFLDRYFVFTDEHWEPPEDYSRKTGLVEAIRQSQLEAEERQELLDEKKPKNKHTHDPVDPVPVPSIAASQKPTTGGTTGAPEGATPPANNGGNGGRRNRGNGGGTTPAPAPSPRPERIE